MTQGADPRIVCANPMMRVESTKPNWILHPVDTKECHLQIRGSEDNSARFAALLKRLTRWTAMIRV